jgi:hypothetical protein
VGLSNKAGLSNQFITQLIMDVVKLEPDSDSDCHQMSAVNDGSFDGMREEQRTLSGITSEVKVGDALS